MRLRRLRRRLVLFLTLLISLVHASSRLICRDVRRRLGDRASLNPMKSLYRNLSSSWRIMRWKSSISIRATSRRIRNLKRASWREWVLKNSIDRKGWAKRATCFYYRTWTMRVFWISPIFAAMMNHLSTRSLKQWFKMIILSSSTRLNMTRRTLRFPSSLSWIKSIPSTRWRRICQRVRSKTLWLRHELWWPLRIPIKTW